MTTLEDIFKVKQVEKEPSTIRGILQTKNYNDFIILSDTGNILYQFTGAKLANKCLPGDHVEWIHDKCQLELRDEHPVLVGTIELTNKARYGLTSRGIPIYLFTPYNKSYPYFIVGCSEKDISANRIALITFDKWTVTFPRGNIKSILGISGEYYAECEALIWQACPYVYPVFDYCPVQTQHNSKYKRTLLTGYTFNIDPKGCKDVDDVFTFERLSDCEENEELWKVTITISDVASYVEDGSPIDIMASLIGQTLYNQKGSVIRPMLPSAYSEGTCSLLAGKQCSGVSLQFIWNGSELYDCTWLETTVEVNRSYTYEEFQESESIYKDILGKIASYMANKTINDSHKCVEQMMIFYNKQAGSILKRLGMGILRKHSSPNLERLEKYKIHLSHIADIDKLAYSSAEYCLAEEIDTVHYGLESTAYAHATSPIRRYADIINQRVLKNYINTCDEYFIVPQAMYDMNKREKANKHFARDIDYLNAITTNQPTTGIILEKIKKDDTMKIKIYIPLWKRIISTTYKYISENCVLSRDEKTYIDVTDYTEVQINYTCVLTARNWKDRVIISIY